MKLKCEKVAVIMRTKDRNLFLKRALKSVINQTYKEWILVIVNDGGDVNNLKNLLEAYTEYKDKIVVINNEKSLGMEAASNKGIMAVNSDYIIIHDDDDTWELNFLCKTVNYLESTPNCKGVITHSNNIVEYVKKEKIKIKKTKSFNSNLKGMICAYDLCNKNIFSPISFIYRREVVNEIGLYDESLPVLGDWEFNIRFIRKYDIHIIEESLANYHQRPKVRKGIYSNSIIGGKKTHLYYEALLKNKFLREDLDSGKFGIGTVINISRGINNGNSLYKIREIIRTVLRL
jgi:glycosyltransferase involved in cell wall biosynthesis